MRKRLDIAWTTFLSLAILAMIAFEPSARVEANTPGQHTVKLTWTASTTPGVTYNLYRGSAAGVCTGNPTPYATGITGTTYVDQNTPAGTYFYNISAVSASGGESACDGEISVVVPNVSTTPASGLSGVVQ